MSDHKIFSMPFARVYPLYITKAERKNRLKSEVDELIYWLTGYDEGSLEEIIREEVSMAEFFNKARYLNPLRDQIKGSICGIKIELIEDDLMREIRYLDKIIDELAKGKSMDKIKHRK